MHDEKMDLSDIAEIINRRRKLIYAIFCLGIVIALMINILVSPQYAADVSLRVNSNFRASNGVVGTLLSDELDRQLNTYAEILKSRVVIETVIDKLYSDEKNRPTYYGMVKNIQVQPMKDTEILNITVEARSPEEAQIFADTLISVFNEQLTKMVRSEGKEARMFIGERLAEAKRNLDKAEWDMVAYKKDKQILSVTDQTKSLIDGQVVLKKMFVDNQLMLETARSKLVSVSGQIAGQNPGFIGDSPLIQQYRSKLADQEVELVGLRKRYTENHPKVAGLQAAITLTSAKLKEEIVRVANAEVPSSNPVYQGLLQSKMQAATDVAVGQAQQEALERANAEYDKALTMLPDKEQGLARFIRDYAVAEEAYTTLAKRYDQARIDEVMQPTNVQVVDTANLQDLPVKPRKLLNLVVATVFGLFTGVMAAFVVDYFYKTIDSPEDVKQYLGIRVIGSIPRYNQRNTENKSLWRKLLNKLKPQSRRDNYENSEQIYY